MRKIISVLLATVMTASLLCGCGNSSGSSNSSKKTSDDTVTTAKATNEETKQVTLSFMNHTSEETTVKWEDSVIAEFEKQHPNVTVEVQRMSYDSYIQTLQTKFASGDAPDIYALENTYIQKYVDNGYAASLNDTDAVKNFQDGALDQLTYNNSVYAIPYNTNVMCVTYNKDVFSKCGITKLPTTLDEFYTACDKIKAAGVTPIGAGYSDIWCLMADLQADYIPGVLLNDHKAILDVQSRNKKFVDSKEWRGVLERIQERYKYVNKDAFGTDWNTVCTDLANGKVAMTLNGDWASNNILAMNQKANIGAFALPSFNDASKTRLAVQTPSEGYALNAGGKNLDVAKEFLNFWTSAESAASFVKNCNMVCVIKGVKATNSTGALADIMNLMNNGRTVALGPVNHNFDNQYRDAVQTVVSNFLLKNMSVDDALAELDKQFDNIAGK